MPIVDTAVDHTFTSVVHSAPRRFSLHDRCDRCHFQSYYVAQKGSSELLFCFHHGKEHALALEFNGWTVINFSSELNKKEVVSVEK